MDIAVDTFQVRTSGRCQMVDITADVAAIVGQSGINDGMCTVYCKHTTAAITINILIAFVAGASKTAAPGRCRSRRRFA